MALRNVDLEKALLADPNDLDRYRAYSDWLVERGQAWGELIDVQLQLESAVDEDVQRQLSEREHTLIGANLATRLGAWAAEIWQEWVTEVSWQDPPMVFERGFLTHLKDFPWFRPNQDETAGNAKLADLARLSDAKTLRSLWIRVVDDDGLPHIPAFDVLESLTLYYSGVTDAGLAHLHELCSLHRLDLTGSQQINGAGLRDLTGLKTLDLRLTAITDTNLALVATFTELERLSCAETNVTDAGVAHLAGLTRLQHLNLYHASLTDAVVESLVRMTNLRFLDVAETPLSAAAVETLRAALPDCEVVGL